MGTVLLPGTAFVELALAAAQHVGASGVEEIVLEAPLILSDQDAVQLQINVGELTDEDGREIVIYSRALASSEDDLDPWTRHASGVLSAAPKTLPLPDPHWPPPGAQEIPGDELYARLKDAGYDYGPVFQGLRRAWRRGAELFAEVALDAEQAQQADRYALHPALLDAALHVMIIDAVDRGELPTAEIPFSFGGVQALRHGHSELRACISDGEHGRAFVALDSQGQPILSIAAIHARPIEQDALTASGGPRHADLYEIQWQQQTMEPADASLRLAVIGDGVVLPGVKVEHHAGIDALNASLDADALVPQVVIAAAPADSDDSSEELSTRVHAVTQDALALVKTWLAADRLEGARLLVLSKGALAVGPTDTPNLAQAAIAGLLRSAHSEHPGRVSLLDRDDMPAEPAVVQAAIASEEPELAIREGLVYAPRLIPTKLEGQHAIPPLAPDGTVLITGGTGGLGAAVAIHFAKEHGARRLLLASRSGPGAEGAEGLVEQLAALGCQASIASCDVCDREQVRALLKQIPAEHPLDVVVHAAGVIDDDVVTAVEVEQLQRVMAPKVDAALHLHEIARPRELILFSSIAATLGSPRRASYAAANSFLDALARHRRQAGLPAVSLAFGLWEMSTGMTGDATDSERNRMIDRFRRTEGLVPLSDDQGLGLLDVARGVGAAVLAPVRLDLGALRAQARGGLLPAVLRGLVRAPARRASDQGSLARRLAGVPESEWDTFVLEFVRGHVAAVLGHASADAIDIDRAFNDLGFDSLGAIELRNRLTQAAGVRLSSTLVFDHPTTAAVAALLRSKVEGAGSAGSTVDAELDRLEAMFSALMRDDAAREQLDRRLRQLKARLGAFSAGVPDRDVVAGEDLDSASDADLAAIIEQELGS